VTYTIVINETAILDAASVEFSLDFASRSFQIELTGASHGVDFDGVTDEQLTWSVTGGGQVTEDGFLYGSGQHVTDGEWLSPRYNFEYTDYNYPVAWVGAIADDLRSVAFTECNRPDYLPTLEQLQAAGRAAFLSNPIACGGYSVLRCSVE
jgi:hypothetical protein